MHSPKKSLSQNFLIDEFIISRIISSINPKKNEHIIEIGPGHGALTDKMYPEVARFDAIELDKNLYHELSNKYKANHLNVHHADALEFCYSDVVSEYNLKIVGNLPYNVATMIIIQLIQSTLKPIEMIFMVQLEVAKRIIARPRCKDYGRLSLLCQYYCNCDILFEVEPDAFYPKPKVKSAIVKFRPNIFHPQAVSTMHLEKIIALAFNQRRKTIKNSLKNILKPDSLSVLGIKENSRAEELSLNDFVLLSNHLCNNTV